jgi:hypothetical protein
VKVRAKSEARESHFMFLGVWENVREWTSTLPKWELPSDFSLWELESQWSPKFSKSDFKGQNPLDWRFPYIIGKLLELKCLKWARMTHLSTQNISYGKKKNQESNCQFDSQCFVIPEYDEINYNIVFGVFYNVFWSAYYSYMK